MKLAEYEAAIAASSDHRRLRGISWEIRRVAWGRWAWPEARRLATLADARASEIEEARGLVPSGPRPRWDEARNQLGEVTGPMIR